MFSYLGAGVSVWVGCTQAVYDAVYSFHGLGGVAAQSAGFMTWVGCPVFCVAAIQHFAGLGYVYWQGVGAAVIALSPAYTPNAILRVDGNGDQFYISGHTFVKGKGVTYVDKNVMLTSNDNSTKQHGRRRGKRYLTSMTKALPFPWDVEAQEAGSSESSRVYMYKTNSFETIDDFPSLKDWVPEKMLEATQLLQTDAGFRELRQTQKHKPPRRNTLYVGEGTDACDVCEVDSVGGPGAGECATNCEAVAS